MKLGVSWNKWGPWVLTTAGVLVVAILLFIAFTAPRAVGTDPTTASQASRNKQQQFEPYLTHTSISRGVGCSNGVAADGRIAYSPWYSNHGTDEAIVFYDSALHPIQSYVNEAAMPLHGCFVPSTPIHAVSVPSGQSIMMLRTASAADGTEACAKAIRGAYNKNDDAPYCYTSAGYPSSEQVAGPVTRVFSRPFTAAVGCSSGEWRAECGPLTNPDCTKLSEGDCGTPCTAGGGWVKGICGAGQAIGQFDPVVGTPLCNVLIAAKRAKDAGLVDHSTVSVDPTVQPLCGARVSPDQAAITVARAAFADPIVDSGHHTYQPTASYGGPRGTIPWPTDDPHGCMQHDIALGLKGCVKAPRSCDSGDKHDCAPVAGLPPPSVAATCGRYPADPCAYGGCDQILR